MIWADWIERQRDPREENDPRHLETNPKTYWEFIYDWVTL
jgi:hypothetical protein